MSPGVVLPDPPPAVGGASGSAGGPQASSDNDSDGDMVRFHIGQGRKFDDASDLPSFVEGQPLRSDNSARWGYHRLCVDCPLKNVQGSGREGCATSRAFSGATTSAHGRIQVWDFLCQWCRCGPLCNEKVASAVQAKPRANVPLFGGQWKALGYHLVVLIDIPS